ncbi:hypothetical protein B795N_06230 [Marinilactibacillus psychrotolerans]|uniref:GRAM domain-containing protein n=1 Tax=Marinilactibacillus psychrotolerans 42ea TaxID=1255609 RepID=A0A1R4JQX2_9LACT|nr:hypothetical protein [Marinilactibacillus psychrotolerans]GEQ32741.1 hypothetical protein B795N_06230 [Marinilactibacillus psychrotolerans]SJN34183.1 hypothetical protein FM115_06390 [Marinilactibacillus psychrotolerans 42ea]
MENKQSALILPPDEKVILEKRANIKDKWYNYIGGKVILTNKALYFNSNKLNLKEDATRIVLDDIHVLRKGNSLIVFPNRIIVGDRQGNEYTLVVTNRNEFYNAVEEQLK